MKTATTSEVKRARHTMDSHDSVHCALTTWALDALRKAKKDGVL